MAPPRTQACHEEASRPPCVWLPGVGVWWFVVFCIVRRLISPCRPQTIPYILPSVLSQSLRLSLVQSAKSKDANAPKSKLQILQSRSA